MQGKRWKPLNMSVISLGRETKTLCLSFTDLRKAQLARKCHFPDLFIFSKKLKKTHTTPPHAPHKLFYSQIFHWETSFGHVEWTIPLEWLSPLPPQNWLRFWSPKWLLYTIISAFWVSTSYTVFAVFSSPIPEKEGWWGKQRMRREKKLKMSFFSVSKNILLFLFPQRTWNLEY